MSMKNSLTPAGIETATFRFVVKHLSHCATAVRCADTEDAKTGSSKGLDKREDTKINQMLIPVQSLFSTLRLPSPWPP